jgi:eukaryotic-like serine/threonine-protein kinase
MGDLRARLHAALSGRYQLQGELGHGGMAFVYLAHDLKHHRPVAIKVLRPELAAALGPERFLREIEIAARLTHPNILSLHDSGEADGLLYYVMPFVEGESLRDHLARAQRLSLAAAIAIACDVADALDYAHQHGVVHRDIKPENILLSGGHAVVVDFGIARAIAAAGEASVTETGIAVGTPAYMSPEQAAGARELDARSDIYGLACVLHEMLTGQPPFSGPSAQAILAHQLQSHPPSVRVTRREVSRRLDAVIAKALAKAPRSRFPTAAALRDALRGEGMIERHRWFDVGVIAALFGLVLVVAVAVWLARGAGGHGTRPAATAPKLVMVLPFRVTAKDSSIGFLREGMLDLLAARLTGEFGPRAVDPRAVLSGWRRGVGADHTDPPEQAVFALARNLDAATVLSGGIVASPRGLVIQATLSAVPPRPRATTSASVEGRLDSLTHLVDALVVQLLAGQAGESSQRLATLTSTSLPALRAYLEGQANYRRGSYEEAVRSFRRALAIDSTFALAGLGLRNAAIWSRYSGDANAQGLAVAWRQRARLGAHDRTFLFAVAGPRYPSPTSYAEQLSAWERAVLEMPDRAEAWFELGEIYIHRGPLLDLEEAMERSAVAFRRAVELDSAFQAPLQHLFEIAALQDDTANLRRLAGLFLAGALGGERAIARWQYALAVHDTAAVRLARPALDSLDLESQLLVPFYAQIAEVWGAAGGLDDADRASELLLRRSTTRDERELAAGVQHGLALNRGRPSVALRLGATLGDRMRVLDALYWEGDTLAGKASGRRLLRRLAAPGRDQPARESQLADLCAVEQWRLWHGDTASAPSAIARLQSSSKTAVCAAMVVALHAVIAKQAAAAGLVDRLDSLLRQGPIVEGLEQANLVLARLREVQGNLASALVATRRRPLSPGGEMYLSTYLKEQGRLAARLGQRAEAIRAYRHYLILRSAPEATSTASVARVRAELARLLAGQPAPPN